MVMVSMYVPALYTNIPHNDARLVIQDVLDSRVEKYPPTHFLLDLFEIILEKNYFHVEEQFYFQTKGVAMGSTCPASVVNLLMQDLEFRVICNEGSNPFPPFL